MSNFTGRRAPNVSQYIANLNTIPSPHEIATQQQEGFNLEDDLAMFTNTQFFDFDMNEHRQKTPVEYDPAQEERARRENAAAHNKNAKGMEYMNNGEFQFPDFTGFPNVLPDGSAGVPQSIHTSPYPSQGLTSTVGSPTSSLVGPNTGDKRKADSYDPNDPNSLEDASRHAAEEDKRRRNTAASARFRVKKKQREQALERTAKEMTDKVRILEARVGQLEMENKWLKGLITEKNLKTASESAPATDKSDTAENKDGDRITESSKKGVGTEEKADNHVDA